MKTELYEKICGRNKIRFRFKLCVCMIERFELSFGFGYGWCDFYSRDGVKLCLNDDKPKKKGEILPPKKKEIYITRKYCTACFLLQLHLSWSSKAHIELINNKYSSHTKKNTPFNLFDLIFFRFLCVLSLFVALSFSLSFTQSVWRIYVFAATVQCPIIKQTTQKKTNIQRSSLLLLDYFRSF